MFHYTDAHAVLGMVQNREIWANDIAFMNDYREFYEGFEILKGIANDSNNSLRDTAKPVLSAIQGLNQHMGERAFWGRYNAISFCSKPDILDMWRGYGTGVQQFCIEFDVDAIIKSAKDEYSSVRLVECVYSVTEKRDLIEKWLKDLSSNGGLKIEDKGNGQSEVRLTTQGIQDFLDLSLSFKNSGFDAECEGRILIELKDGEKVHHRVNNFGITPYLKIGLPDGCIHGILIGPTSDTERTIYSLRQLFHEDNRLFANDANIKLSEISYRDR